MKKVWRSLRRGLDVIICFQQYVGWACLGVMTGLIVVGTALRYFFNAPWVFTEELVMAIYIPLTFLPLAFIAKSGKHIRVDLILHFLPRNVQDWLELLSLLLVITFSSVYASQTWLLVEHSLTKGLVFETLPTWPRASFQILMLIGMILLALWAIGAFCGKLCEKLRGEKA